MKKMVLVLLVFILFLSACAAQTSSTETTTSPAPPDQTDATNLTQPPVTEEGLILLQDRCTACHSLERITSEGKTPSEWQNVVDQMVNRGAALNSQEIQILLDYLVKTYP